MLEFIRTPMGQKFFNVQIPNIIKELGRIADALEKQNELKEEVKNDDENQE